MMIDDLDADNNREDVTTADDNHEDVTTADDNLEDVTTHQDNSESWRPGDPVFIHVRCWPK